ncbi:MAG: HAD family phosphatase [Oscillospiraceae bacterium]|nr:HAD family phosphatase [Oscillospiraceae bacterium]
MKYKCLILDHDDTVVDSTAHVHHPAFLVALKELRPGHTISLEDYFRMNFHPGFLQYCAETLGFTEAEYARELEIWQAYVKEHIPAVYPGMARIIRRQKELGGLVCVISHSFDYNIRRDYAANGLPEPDAVYGWELPRQLRKPDPWALKQVLARFDLRPEDCLVVDDLKPGYDMARAAAVPFAAACWAYDVPEIRSFMEQNCELAFEDPAELEQYLFG